MSCSIKRYNNRSLLLDDISNFIQLFFATNSILLNSFYKMRHIILKKSRSIVIRVCI